MSLASTSARWVNISAPEASKRQQEFVIIDVRGPDEFIGPLGHIPNAILIPLRKLASSLDRIPPDAPLLVVCRSGRRSTEAAAILTSNGFRDVTNVVGGMEAWKVNELSRCSCTHPICRGTQA